ncbi:hypothetical protein C8F04DRAFT_1181795 [Mycena alexandri]|uniref:Uncharacterized protein n=1 Tax=Mycena alexandri TaxID=1745969 RepID=A0AAD6X224_9AGAR|nr:hypothetical protein C8F04DRAFT_1181795 [Mycena alexandri]
MGDCHRITYPSNRKIRLVRIAIPQARFALSSQQNFHRIDGNFNYADFYWNIVDSLSGDEGQAIIDRFNKKVFGTVSSTRTAAAAVPAGPSDFEVLQAQRAAKRSRNASSAAA